MGSVTQELSSDTPAKAWARALALTANIGRNSATTFPLLVGELAERFGDRVALIGEDETLTYRELAARVNQVARWALEQGLGRGDIVCLVMHNGPTYLATWLGLTRVGAVAALVNTNLVGESLAHALRIAAPRGVIVGADLADPVMSALGMLDAPIPCWVLRGDSDSDLPSFDAALGRHADSPLASTECPPPATRDRALYIYTSGTTGLPKAAIVSH